jgi:regulation of enolase protein 1 (concanavalin A-like superfamily)
MKSYYTVLILLCMSVNVFAQTWSDGAESFTSTLDGGQGLKGKKEVNRTTNCSDFIYEQDIALDNFTGSGFGASHVPGQAWYLFDDFPITTTSTINTVVLGAAHLNETCTSPEFVINFRSNGSNGSYGEILHTRTVAPGAAGYTKECIVADWQAQFYFMFSIYIPIDPLTLAPGTYWMEVYSPNQPSFIAGIFWQQVTPVQGSKARREYNGTDYNFQPRDFAFALSGYTEMPNSYCAPSIEAVCQNTSVALGLGGTANITASAVDGGSSGFTNISVSPSTFNCSNLGPNTVTLTVDDGSGNSDDCTATVTVQDDMGLPASWDANNIGTAPSGNSFNFDACNGSTVTDQFVIGGGGNNAINLMSDNVAFASQTLCGDGSITAKIENVDATGYGGLMIRESAASGSKQVAVFSNMTNSLRYESRTMANMPKTVQSFMKPSPFWLKMVRQGMWVHVSYSSNGMTFQPVQSTMVSMQSCVEIGLASFTYLPTGQTTATFSNVSTTGNIQDLTGGTPTTFAVDTPQPQDHKTVKPHNLILFPNPVTQQFTIQLDAPLQEDAMVEVTNLFGQSMAVQQLPAGQIIQQWQLANWPAGTYVIRVNRAGQAPIVKPFVVSR